MSRGHISGVLTVVDRHESSIKFYWCNCECGRENVLVPRRVLMRRGGPDSCGSLCKIKSDPSCDVTSVQLQKLAQRVAKPTIIIEHDVAADVCLACGVKCVHVENLTPRKRGPKPKPHANRQKLTIYISQALKLAIKQHAPTKDVSVWIREHLESLFPDHRAEAERIFNQEKEKES